MHTTLNARRLLSTALVGTLAGTALALAAPGAQARPSYEFIDRAAFDGAPVVSQAGYTMSAPTRGELGGHLTLTVLAVDGALPGANECEPATVDATLTTSPGETWEISTTGDVCGHFTDGSPSLTAGFGKRQLTYTGPRTRVQLRTGMVSFGPTWLGAQGAVSLSIR